MNVTVVITAITADYKYFSPSVEKKTPVFSRSSRAQIPESVRQEASDLKECTRSVLPPTPARFSFLRSN